MKALKTSENDDRYLNRRNFIKLFLLTGAAAFLSACKKSFSLLSPTPSVRPNPTATQPLTPTGTTPFTPTSTSTITPTATTTSTKTATPTETYPQPPNLQKLTVWYTWTADFDKGYPYLAPPYKGSIVQVINNPTGISPTGGKDRRVLHAKIFDSIGEKEGLNKDGHHRAYIQWGDPSFSPNKGRSAPFLMECYLWIEDIDHNIGKKIHAWEGNNVFALGGDYTTNNYVPYNNTILYNQNSSFFILPMSHDPQEGRWRYGKLVNDNAKILLRSWNQLQTIITDDDVWTLTNGVVTGYMPNLNPGKLACTPNFGPYALNVVNNIDTYQVGHSIRFFK